MALPAYQRALIRLAKGVGYAPPPHAWRDQLLKLNGEFRRSPLDLGGRVALEIMIIGAGAYGLTMSFWSDALGQDLPFFRGMFIVLIGLGLYLVRLNGIWYKFAHGSISALRGKGKVLWQENLADLTYVVLAGRSINPFLTLRWPHRRRRIELYDSLLRELSPSVADRAARP
jgi:hypothetical protein